MKKISLPKTEKLLKELSELNLQVNVQGERYKKAVRLMDVKREEVTEMKREEGLFGDMSWRVREDGIDIYTDCSEEEEEKFRRQEIAWQIKEMFDYFKNNN